MRRIVLFTALAALMAFSAPAFAQYSADNRPLYDRIDRLERDLQTLQAQVSRGGSGSTTVIASPAAPMADMPPAAAPLSPGMRHQLDERVDQLEDQLRQLIGKVEEANHKAMVNADEMKRLQADIDLRFKELQPGLAQTQPAPLASMPVSAGGGTLRGNANVGGNSAEGGPAPGPQSLGSLSLHEPGTPPSAAQAPALTPPVPKDAKGMYEDAYAKADWSRFEGLPLFRVANRMNAYNTYLLMEQQTEQ